MEQGPYDRETLPYGTGGAINVPERREVYPPYGYRPGPPPPARNGLTPGQWAAVAAAVLVALCLAGYMAWDFYQDAKAREIPVYPGSSLVKELECSSGSG